MLAVRKLGEQKDAAGLRHGFNDQHTRHDGASGKVADEVRLVDADVLDRHNTFRAHDLGHSIDQQKWIAMRQDLENLVNVESCRLHGFSGRNFSSVAHGLSGETHDYTFRLSFARATVYTRRRN